MARRSLILTYLVLGLLSAQVLADDIEFSTPDDLNIGLGHLAIRPVSPGMMLKPNVSIPAALDLEAGEWHGTLSMTLANTWNFTEDVLLVDGEFLTLRAEIVRMLDDGVAVGFALPFSGRVGGVLDGIIEGFHNNMGLGNAGREVRPKNETLVFVEDDDGALVSDGSSWGLADIPIYASFLLSRGDDRKKAVILQAGMTLPVGDEDELRGLGAPLVGVGVLISKQLQGTRTIASVGAGLSYCTAGEVAGVELRGEEMSALLGAEYRLKPDVSILAHYYLSSAVAEDFADWSEFAHDLSVGVKWRTSDASVIEVSLMEDMFKSNNNIDFGLHIGWSGKF